MLFCQIGINDAALSDQGKQLHEAYESLRAKDDLGGALKLLDASQAYKMQLLAAARERWIGWLYPLFIEHIHRELAFFQRRISPGGITSRVELCFWDRITAEHAAFAKHLLDPSLELPAPGALADAPPISPIPEMLNGIEQSAIDVSNACARETYATLYALSQMKSNEMNATLAGLDLKTTPSIIHPKLAAHVIREGQRFTGTLRRLSPTVEQA